MGREFILGEMVITMKEGFGWTREREMGFCTSAEEVDIRGDGRMIRKMVMECFSKMREP